MTGGSPLALCRGRGKSGQQDPGSTTRFRDGAACMVATAKHPCAAQNRSAMLSAAVETAGGEN